MISLSTILPCPNCSEIVLTFIWQKGTRMLARCGIIVAVVVSLVLSSSASIAQQDSTKKETIPLGGIEILGGRFDYYLFQPGAYVYFDKGEDTPPDSNGRVKNADFFHDGSTDISIQMLGFDLFWGKGKVRAGLTAGLGVAFNTYSDNGTRRSDSTGQDYGIGSYVALKVGVAVSFSEVVRLEAGYCFGYSARESFDNRKDYALYVGIAFPTKLGELAKKVFD
jgi:hypothetical protein